MISSLGMVSSVWGTQVTHLSLLFAFFCVNFFNYLFLDRGEGREERETNIQARDTSIGCLLHAPKWGPRLTATQACALTGNGTSNLPAHRGVLSPVSHTSHGYVLNFFVSTYLDLRFSDEC